MKSNGENLIKEEQIMEKRNFWKGEDLLMWNGGNGVVKVLLCLYKEGREGDSVIVKESTLTKETSKSVDSSKEETKETWGVSVDSELKEGKNWGWVVQRWC